MGTPEQSVFFYTSQFLYCAFFTLRKFKKISFLRYVIILIRHSFLCHLNKVASLRNKMSLSDAKGFILLGIIILVPKPGLSELPYEVLDSLVELSEFDDFKDLMKVNVSDERGPTRPIYRLDLGPDYVAYYEIDTGKDYVILSSGPRTKDFREVQSGPDPRPTDLLIQQAKKNGQKCEKFYRLSPVGLTICNNYKGTVVAASYNWTADVAEVFFFLLFLLLPPLLKITSLCFV